MVNCCMFTSTSPFNADNTEATSDMAATTEKNSTTVAEEATTITLELVWLKHNTLLRNNYYCDNKVQTKKAG